MARAQLPFYVYQNKRKDVKTRGGVWYYSISRVSGLPNDICEREHRKSTGKRRKSDAVEWLLNERIPELEHEAANRVDQRNDLPLREYLDPFYIPGICPHLARLEADRRKVSVRWIVDQRSRLKRLVFNDEISQIGIPPKP